MIKRLLLCGAVLFAVNVFSFTPTVSAQTIDGSIVIQTMDATKALVAGTHLVLTDTETNQVREGTTSKSGTYTFGDLPPASYTLTVDHAGFSSVNYASVLVQAGVATPLNITLAVGSDTQKIEVSGTSAPLIETSSNTLSTTVDMTEINNLPVANRSLLSLQALTPGYASINGNGTGTFNGTAQAAYEANLDGINSTSQRGKSGAGSGAAVTFRVENIQEFTVQSGELAPSQGGGQSAAQTLLVTNRGTNKYHGRLFENYQMDSLNAAPWANGFLTTPQHKPHLIINDFGASVGGPIFKDKFFFFGNFSGRISPNAAVLTAVVPTDRALQGYYRYCNTTTPLQQAGATSPRSTYCSGLLRMAWMETSTEASSFRKS